jgi:hypothetical protein
MAMQATTETLTTDRFALATTGLEPDSALSLRATFEPMLAKADEWSARAKLIVVTNVDDKRGMKMARESRLALREIRVKVEHERKRLKEDSTRRGKAIDGMANVFKALVEPIEAYLLEQETFAERAETARKDALRSARIEALVALGADPSVYANLGETSEETWTLTLEAARAAKESREEAAKQAELVRIEAERIAAEKRETERLARIQAEAERVARERAAAEENARLQAEKAELEAKSKAEREQAAAELAEVEAKAAAERDAAAIEAAAAKATADRIAAEQNAALTAAKTAAAEAEAEAARVKAKHEAERQAAERETKRKHDEDLAARQAAALAPDREKLAAFAATLRALEIPTLTTPPGKAAAAKVADQIAKMASWIEKTGAAL